MYVDCWLDVILLYEFKLRYYSYNWVKKFRIVEEMFFLKLKKSYVILIF